MAFNPNEPRDEFGRWTSFGGALSGGDGRRRPRPLRPQDRRVRRETRPFRGFGIKGEVRYLGEHGFWEIRRGGGRGWRTQNPYGLPTLKGFGGRHAIGTDGDLAIFPDLDAAESGWIDDLAYNGNRLTVGQFLKNHFAKLGIDGEHPLAELSDKLKDRLEKPILGMGGEARTHLVTFLEDLHPMTEDFIEHGPVTHDTPLPDPHAAHGQSQHGGAGPQGAESSDWNGKSVSNAKTIHLTHADIINLKKTLQTEWNLSSGETQAYGIIDTILNSQASGHWGSTVADVVNAKKQFSNINGPIAWYGTHEFPPHHAVEDIPATWVKKRTRDLVDSYLAARSNGKPSSVGDHLNYANPYYSSPSNLPWIMRLSGPVLGKGKSIHRHGTVEGLQKYRPGSFNITISH